MSRNGNCDAKHHGNASAGTMVRLKLVFAARMCLQAVLDISGSAPVTDRASKSNQQNILKKTKRRLVTNEVRTRSERGTKRGQKLPGTDPYPNVWILANADRQRTSKKKEHRMAHTHPRAKTTYMTNPKCLNVIHQNISLYILFHAILSYLNLTNPHKHICCEKKSDAWQTHI